MDLDFSLFTNALIIAVEVIAVIEAIKNFFKNSTKKLPTFLYVIFSLLLSFGLALIQCNAFVWQEIKINLPIGLLAFSLAQIGYDSIWKAIQKKLNGNE